jgi:alkylation response protein AidB-like acyl-CoA dehydrogenase
MTVRQYTAPIKDMKFLINEVYDFPKHYATNLKNTGGGEATPDMIDAVLDETAKFAQDVLGPLVKVGDQVGCKWIDKHTVITPPGFKEAYDQFVAGGWQGLSYPVEYGGQNMPMSMSIFQSDITAVSTESSTRVTVTTPSSYSQ